MPITRRSLLLRGAGAALGLPWLERFLPRADAAEPALPLRLVYVYLPNGVDMAGWTPSEEGGQFALPPLLEPLAPFRARMLLLSGLALRTARANGDGPGDHARAAAAFLTCRQPFKTAGADIKVGVSADQLAAKHLGPLTRFPSLELGTEPSAQGGSCDSGYSCAYSSNIAWRTPNQPLAKEVRPRALFARLFGELGVTPEERRRRLRERQSVLDAVSEDAARLRARLGLGDRDKLEEYLTAVREVEQRLAREGRDESAAPPPPLPGVPRDLGEHLRQMYDLLALALQSDATRVATFLLGNEGSNRSYPELGVPEGHHHLSHHGGDPDKLDKIRRIDRFHIEQLAYFLTRLDAIREGEHSLLERTLLVFGSGIADGNRHDHHDLPIALFGGGAAGVTGGRHLRCADQAPLADLHLALLQRLGAPVSRFADARGPLTGLEARAVYRF